ncbi:8-amino-7-oxononanoate synthase [Desulfurivibrio sp. D14AmB]|uniref:8-amino-7-oxononanoate synthase n=1 Tax=Desulfurivibrio sp. D14AmB TaxID=3374370 RepID=UPI00376F2D65
MVRLSDFLSEQQRRGKLRRLLPLEHPEGGRIALPQFGEMLDFSSNDYLGLSRHPRLLTAAAEAMSLFGTGAGSARLMGGNLELHRRLEAALALFKGLPAALLFGSGYLANIGIIPALVGRHDQIFADRLSHASIYDGCRLSGAQLHRFHHNDCNHLEELLQKRRGGAGQALIVVESLYSMDGDLCPLAEVVELKERYGCRLLVDEAHATGLFGPHGAGLVAEAGLAPRVDLVMGTLGKALGSYGAYVAGDREMIDYLVNRARSFIFSTALPPATTAAALAALALMVEEPELRTDLWRRVDFFKGQLTQAGIETDLGPSQIIPLPVGKSAAAALAAEELRSRGLFVVAVRPPTVPEGSARLRLSVTRHLSEGNLAEAALLLAAGLRPGQGGS